MQRYCPRGKRHATSTAAARTLQTRVSQTSRPLDDKTTAKTPRVAILLRPYREDYRAEVLVSWITTGYWVLTLALVWWTPWAGIPWLFTSLFATLVRPVVRRGLRSALA